MFSVHAWIGQVKFDKSCWSTVESMLYLIFGAVKHFSWRMGVQITFSVAFLAQAGKKHYNHPVEMVSLGAEKNCTLRPPTSQKSSPPSILTYFKTWLSLAKEERGCKNANWSWCDYWTFPKYIVSKVHMRSLIMNITIFFFNILFWLFLKNQLEMMNNCSYLLTKCTYLTWFCY